MIRDPLRVLAAGALSPPMPTATFPRRTFLGAAAVLAAACGKSASKGAPGAMSATAAANVSPQRMPIGFVGHGSPMVVFDQAKGRQLRAWADSFAKPRAILVVSAHWISSPISIGTTRSRELYYDFGGFPDELYQVKYAAPGAPEIATRITSLFGEAIRASDRPLDHGAWTPLVHMYPAHDVPVIQVSMPAASAPAELFELGRKLAPLADEGVFILGSGNVTHNLRRIAWEGEPPPPAWASEFDAWTTEVTSKRDYDALLAYKTKAPALAMNHPTEEHFSPLLAVAGAASARGDANTSYPIVGWEHGSLSRRCIQFS